MKKVVWLRIYKGQEVLKKENGEVKNENQIVKLTHNTLEWKLFMKNLRVSSFCKVAVEKVLHPTKDGYDQVEYFEDLKKEVDLAFHGEKIVILTPEQKEIDKLKAQMKVITENHLAEKEKLKKDDELVKKNIKDVTKVDPKKGGLAELSDDKLKAEYEKVYKKKPNHLMKRQTLISRIESKK